MLPIAERLCYGSAATTEENAALARDIIEIALTIAQLQLAQVSGQEVGPFFVATTSTAMRSSLGQILPRASFLNARFESE